ncbi:acyl-CoA dehydrogenase family protein [Myxococcota bacterium]|nr:acyl-CoA dehydrogenase family protein [Myxococcota bacterium]
MHSKSPVDPAMIGREALGAWRDDQPKSFFEAVPLLTRLIERDWPEAERARRLPALRSFGAAAAGPLDAVVTENNLHRNLPVLDPYDGVGRRQKAIVHHPTYAEAGRIIYGSGVMAAYGETPTPHQHILSLFFLSSHVGEGGHNCPLACTAGAIRAIQRVGSPAQREWALPRLLDPRWDHNFTAAQFLTEVQGGSDVGNNGVIARPAGDGGVTLHGEKWFCSNADADVILLTARPEGGAPGTRGLGLYLMPERLPDGSYNHYRLRRLKDKLGTRSMASAEIDLNGAWAEPLGPVEHGFRTTMEEVINTSRLYNAFSVAGLASRALLIASGYAHHRRAFGQRIVDYPLVAETLAWMRADVEGALAASWLLAGVQERLDLGQSDEAERAFFRVALNLNKLRTAIQAHDVILRGIEVLGGNGAIESFSALPRLLRDNVVCENWEGTHNVLRAQVLRDARRLGVHQGFFETLRARLDPGLVDPVVQAFDATLAQPEGLDTLRMRGVADRMATLVQLAGLQGLHHEGTQARAELLARRHLGGGGDGSLAETANYPALLRRAEAP